jgi:3-hydroxybutyrate dehydrogenase
VDKLAEFSRDRFGRVDILVNNAGIQHVAPVEAFADECWDEVLSLNLSAAFHATKAVLPGMRQRGWGRIINIASVHGLVASANKCAYVAAKHGLVGFTKVVALETANDGITCNAICPGWVLTDLVQRQVEARRELLGQPRRRRVLTCCERNNPCCSSRRPRASVRLLYSMWSPWTNDHRCCLHHGWWLGCCLS